ncbi:MAG TPA: hypothetical protein VGD90_12465 [Sphingobacteriaceae bacterium]
MQLSEKDRLFLKTWAVTRQNKWRFIFEVLIFWSILCACSLIFKQFEIGSAAGAMVTLVFTFVYRHAKFHSSEDRYQVLLARISASEKVSHQD